MKTKFKNIGESFTYNGSDKQRKHRYGPVYEQVFKEAQERVQRPLNILEVGVWKGHGMAAMVDYMPDNNYYGIDIFTRIEPEDVPILNHEKVQWIKGDSTIDQIKAQIREAWGNIKFDVIIDDGAHWPSANMNTLKNTVPFLADDGTYVIEDVWPLDKMSIQESNHDWLRKHPDRYSWLDHQELLRTISSLNFDVWEQVDLRKETGEPDSYLYILKHKGV